MACGNDSSLWNGKAAGEVEKCPQEVPNLWAIGAWARQFFKWIMTGKVALFQPAGILFFIFR